MPIMVWNDAAERYWDFGIDKVALYPYDAVTRTYGDGVPWNGFQKITEQPSGGEHNPLYALNRQYGTIVSPDQFACSMEMLRWPVEFFPMLGVETPVDGMYMPQQVRLPFCMAYRQKRRSDHAPAHGYIIHVLYNLYAKPYEQMAETVNEQINADVYTIEATGNPMEITRETDKEAMYKIMLDSTLVPAAALTLIEEQLWGSAGEGASVLTPDNAHQLITENP